MSEPVSIGESDLDENDAPSRADEPSGPGCFRFDEGGRELLASVAQWLAIAAFTGWAVAATSLALAIPHGGSAGSNGTGNVALQLAMAAVNGVISWWFLKIRRDFLEAATPGNHEHRATMDGLEKIASYYAVHKFLLQLMLGLMAVGFVATILSLVLRC